MLPANFVKDKSNYDELKELVFDESLYGVWLETCNETPRERQMFLEKIIEDIEPDGSYLLFAHLIKEKYVNNIFTTNFDDLLNTALLKYYDTVPRIFSHNEAALYINVHSRRPNIIKLHGDYLFEDIKNTNDETMSLQENMKKKFEEALSVCGLIVVGYRGSDQSIMKLLEEKINSSRGNFILIWVCDGKEKLHWRVKNLLSEKKCFYVEVKDFDTLTAVLWNKFKFLPSIDLKKTAEERNTKYYNHIERAVLQTDKRGIELSKLATDNYEKKKYKIALEALDELIALLPSKSELYKFRGDVYDDSGDKNKALADYGKAIEFKPDDADAYYNRGILYYNSGEKDKALADYNKAIELKPDDADAHYNRGLLYVSLEKTNEAFWDFSKAIEMKSDYSEAYNNRGILYKNSGEEDKALADYNKAIELKPDYATAYNNRGILYYNSGEKDKALADYNKAIELKPDFSEAYNNRGLLYYNSGEKDKALADYNKAIELKPDNSDTYYNRGNLYNDLGEKNKALADYTKAIELKSDDADAYFNRGILCDELGKEEQALADYTKAIELKPDDLEALNNRGKLYFEIGELEKALDDCNKGLEVNPNLDTLNKIKTLVLKAIEEREKKKTETKKAKPQKRKTQRKKK
ncbi:MAG: tetratricopeptide repeat protein [Bacteroidetes bacterium]|nr:tetratricopeptide repeat protein [Bacteroidota bacterium]